MKNVNKYCINKIPQIYFLGRNINDVQNKNSRTLFWAGSGFEVHFSGQELWALVEADYTTLEPWIAIFLNGRINSRQMIEKGKHWICLARGFDNFYQTDIRVIKDSQPMTDDPMHYLKIHKLALTKGGVFSKTKSKDLKIEFIGDSITTGEGLAGAVGDMDWISCHMSFCKTYAYQIAQKMNADFRIMSQGGYGIASAWNNNPYGIIPPHYENVCSIVKCQNVKRSSANNVFKLKKDPCAKLSVYEKLGGNQKYDFKSWQPDFIVINLGTNDFGGFYNDGWTDPITNKTYKMQLDKDEKPCEESAKKIFLATKEFLSVIRKNNINAKIIWTLGMMKITSVSDIIFSAIEEFKNETNDKNIFVLELRSMDLETTDDDKGSRQHPGPLTHKNAVTTICELMEKLS